MNTNTTDTERSFDVHVIVRIDGVTTKDEAETSVVSYMHDGVQDRADWTIFKIESA